MLDGVSESEIGITKESDPNKEAELISRLDGFVNDFSSGYKVLSSNVGEYLINSTSPIPNEDKLREASANLIPLRRAQLLRLAKMSDHLGVPLSPLGLMSFTSTSLMDVELALVAGFASEMGGQYFSSSDFKNGEAAKTGMWFLQSKQAGDFTDDIFAQDRSESVEPEIDEEGYVIIQGQIPPEVPTETFSPQKDELAILHERIVHEAFHGIHLPFNDIENIEEFERKLLWEGLAFRTSLIMKTRTAEEIKKTLIENTSYFGNMQLSSQQLDQIDKFFGIITKSLEPSYQQEVTWRGMVCKSLSEFLEPTPELTALGSSLSEHSTKVAIPNFKRNLGISLD